MNYLFSMSGRIARTVKTIAKAGKINAGDIRPFVAYCLSVGGMHTLSLTTRPLKGLNSRHQAEMLDRFCNMNYCFIGGERTAKSRRFIRSIKS